MDGFKTSCEVYCSQNLLSTFAPAPCKIRLCEEMKLLLFHLLVCTMESVNHFSFSIRLVRVWSDSFILVYSNKRLFRWFSVLHRHVEHAPFPTREGWARCQCKETLHDDLEG